MNRRKMLNLFGALPWPPLSGAAGISGLSFAQDQKKMVTVVKIAGIPWFNALENGVKKAGRDFGIDASVVGPANLDPAQQVKLLEDLIAQKVDVIGLVPIDVKMAEPVLKRAQEAGIPVITHEGPEQEGRTWNVELIDSVVFGEVQMQKLAKEMGEEGEYAVYVGSLTTPLHNIWADAAIAYQKANYPNMKLVADRFPGADEIDTAYKTTLDVIKAYPNLKGILAFGSNGPIGAGSAVREKGLSQKNRRDRHGGAVAGQAADHGWHHPRRLSVEPDGCRLRHGGGRQAGARRHADRRRRRDPRPRQGGGRRRQQADQGREDHDRQQGHGRRPDQAGPLTA